MFDKLYSVPHYCQVSVLAPSLHLVAKIRHWFDYDPRCHNPPFNCWRFKTSNLRDYDLASLSAAAAAPTRAESKSSHQTVGVDGGGSLRGTVAITETV